MGERRVGPLFSFRAEHKHGARTGQETHTGPGRDRTRTRVLDGTRGDSTQAHTPDTHIPKLVGFGRPPADRSRLERCGTKILLVHDDATHRVELLRLERLGEEVCDVVGGAHEGHLELERLDHVPHEERLCTCFMRSWCSGL